MNFQILHLTKILKKKINSFSILYTSKMNSYRGRISISMKLSSILFEKYFLKTNALIALGRNPCITFSCKEKNILI